MSDFSLLSLLKTSLYRTIEGTHPFAVGSLHVELYIKINKTEKSIVYNYIHILNVMTAGGLAPQNQIQPTISLVMSVPSQGHYGFQFSGC